MHPEFPDSWFASCDRVRDPAGALRMAEFVTALSRFPVGHLVDLGAGHGIFSRLAADLGWRVTAVDARDVRFPDDERVRWVTADVREFDEYDDVTVVACLGLWYHLTLADQLTLIAKIAPRPVILDTHVAREDLADHPVHRTKLSGFVSEGDYTGRLYSESGKASQATASWGNTQSFWPTAAGLERQLTQAGYDLLDRLVPAVAADREYLVAQTMADDARARLDELVTRYNPLRPQGELVAEAAAAAPAPAEGARGVGAGAATLHRAPASLSVRRLAGALRRGTRRG
jgi:hypothetical protein